jgi:CheY-like chemotaxis protein
MDTKIRAMVFDDDAEIRSVLVKIMEERGYEVLAFARASVCQMCRCPEGHMCADLTICDVSMPGLRGVEFLEHQTKRGCRNKNVALMSAYWSASDRRRTTGLGCQVFQKPFSIGELTNWLDDSEKTIHPNRVLTSWFQENAQAVGLEEDPYQWVAAAGPVRGP